MGAYVNMHEAKSQLSKLVERVRLGEEVVIAKDGRPVARLVAVEPAQAERPIGLYAGRIVIHADFDAPLPEELLEALR